MNKWSAFVITGTLAGGAVYFTSLLQMPVWVLFLTWVAYFLVGATPKAGLKLAVTLTAGLFLGWCIILLGTGPLAMLGSFAMPLAVFVVAGAIPLVEEIPPLDGLAAYFFGIIVFFASGAPMDLPSNLALVGAAFLGVVAGWLHQKLRAGAGAVLSSRVAVPEQV